MSDAREVVLARVRAALADVPGDEAPSWDPAGLGDDATAYRRAARHAEPAQVVELLAQRIREYRATVTRVRHEDGLTVAIAEILERHAARRVLIPPALSRHWRPAGFELISDDPPLDHQTLATADGVITGCRLAIAMTGTIVLDGDARSGRRVLTLLPDLHLCVVLAEQVVSSVPEGVAAIAPALREGRPLTFVSGPSATSDIELDRVEGVHGPRRLEVLIVG